MMGYDIAPEFCRLIKVFPLDVLETMKEHLEASKEDRAILLAVAEIQQEMDMRILENQGCDFAVMPTLRKISDTYSDISIKCMQVYNYGVMQGKRQERARRKGNRKMSNGEVA